MPLTYIMLRRATSSAFAVAKRTVSLRAHGHGKLCRQLYGSPTAPMSSLFFSSGTSRSKKGPYDSCQKNNNSSSDSDEDNGSFGERKKITSESESDFDNRGSPSEGEGHVAPKSYQASDPDQPTMAILDIIESKLQRSTTNNTPAKRLTEFPFSIECLERSPTILTLKRKYGNEEINVGVSKYAIEARTDIVPLNISVNKEGGHSLLFGIHAFPEKLKITSFLTSSTDATGRVRSYVKPDISEINGLNLSMNFIEYLDIRGINPSTINTLRLEKVQEKDSSDQWMKSLKKFMEM